MKTYLEVPYSQHHSAKHLGAMFDMAEKKWYCPDGKDLMIFARWISADLSKWAKLPKKAAKRREKPKNKEAIS
jgi:hypothetical protein